MYFNGLINENSGNLRKAAKNFKDAIESILKFIEEKSYTNLHKKSPSYPKSWEENQEYIATELEKGLKILEEKKYKKAIEIFKTALEKVGIYPTKTGENISVY